MKTESINKLSKRLKIPYVTLWRIRNGEGTTIDKNVAIEVARLSGKKPIDHIRPVLRYILLKMYPELNLKVKRNGHK